MLDDRYQKTEDRGQKVEVGSRNAEVGLKAHRKWLINLIG
jgi:hypothetical protein